MTQRPHTVWPYHLEHNFGHGDQNLSTMLAAMNILAFLLHTVLGFTDANYKLVREELPSRETYFQHVKALTIYLCFPSWGDMLDFMMKGLRIAADLIGTLDVAA